jgi:hypothetical protein
VLVALQTLIQDAGAHRAGALTVEESAGVGEVIASVANRLEKTEADERME